MNQQKNEIREEVSAKKKALSLKQVEEYSAALLERFCVLPEYQEAECIYAYMSFNEEVLTMPIIERAWADGKRVAVPKTYASGKKRNAKGKIVVKKSAMTKKQFNKLKAKLKKGGFKGKISYKK